MLLHFTAVDRRVVLWFSGILIMTPEVLCRRLALNYIELVYGFLVVGLLISITVVSTLLIISICITIYDFKILCAHVSISMLYMLSAAAWDRSLATLVQGSSLCSDISSFDFWSNRVGSLWPLLCWVVWAWWHYRPRSRLVSYLSFLCNGVDTEFVAYV